MDVATPAATSPEGVDLKKSSSKTVTDTVSGEHEHTIVGYSLVKGIGDGEPIASERFTVGGHEWVLLFYPDGKRSSASEAPPGMPRALPLHHDPNAAAPQPAGQQPAPAANAGGQAGAGNAQQAPAAGAGAQAIDLNAAQNQAQAAANNNAVQHHRREFSNDYAALFVALIGEGENPQGVVNTSEGRVVRAFHRFTLVDQSGGNRHLSKGRRREQGAVKISCARQDPNARNCHGYRKFVKRSVLENPQNGYMANDTIIIRYTIELVVSSGGALSKQPSTSVKNEITIPPSSLGHDIGTLLEGDQNTDVTFLVEEESLPAHKLLLAARSPVFQALLNGEMREGVEGVVTIEDIRVPVFRALLHFLYTDSLPEELEGTNLDAAMAQHLMVAADRYQVNRLRRICERRLCETVEISTVATTMTLAEQNHGEELKRVCLEFVSKNLAAVMATEGYQYLISSCPALQTELLNVLAEKNHGHESGHKRRMREHNPSDGPQEAEMRRMRQRRE